jgi:hypothetical protein
MQITGSVVRIFTVVTLSIAVLSCNASAEDQLTQEAISKAEEYFFHRGGAECGTAWSFGFNLAGVPALIEPFQPQAAQQFDPATNYLQATGLTLVIQPAQPGNVSIPDRSNGVLWRGTISWKADAHRIYDATGVLSGERGWTPWRGQGQTVLSATMEFRNGQWQFLSTAVNVGSMRALQLFTPNCSAIEQAENTPVPSLRETRQQELEQLRQREQQMWRDQELRRQESERQRQETYQQQKEMMERRKQEEWEAIRRMQQ